MDYFKDCITLDEAKKRYRTLLMISHPDKGGSHADTIELINQFKAFKPTKQAKTDENFNFEKFHDLVMKFEHLDNLTVSFVGTWIWIEGNTYPQKDKIKAIEVGKYDDKTYDSPYFAKKKKAWYIAPKTEGKKRRSSGKTLEQIKAVYGSESYKTKSQKYLV